MRFFLLVCCYATGKIQPNIQNKPQFPHFLFSMPPNLFTMMLVNRSCASSANLMSKPFLIYCEIFFSRRHKVNWKDAYMDCKNIIYTACHCSIYTKRSKIVFVYFHFLQSQYTYCTRVYNQSHG